MAKEKEEKESKSTREREGGKKDGEGEREHGKPKKHLHSLRLEVTRDHKGKATGIIEHHTYKAHPTDHHTEPERPVNVHNTPEEAAESVQDHMSQAMGGGGAEPEEAAGTEPAPAGNGAEPAGM